MQRIARAAVAAGLLVTVAGCGADEAVVAVDDRGTVSVAEGAHVPGTQSDAVTVAVGEKVVVDLGYQNSSIGDGWFLVGPPDPAVLADEGEHYESECDQSGCGADMTWHFATVGTGKTAITLRYCYRSRPPNCDPMPDRGPAEPVTLTVTVMAA
jgi:predicted secreted protein